MPFGYNGRILHVDLSDLRYWVEQPSEVFYRRYLGGSCLGAYYVLNEVRPEVDPFAPENVIVFAASVATGVPVPGFSRYSVVSKSPLTGGIGEAEAGGYWGAELKFAGYDAVVIRGKAPYPVYLWIKDGNVEIRKAVHLWGKTTGEVQELVRQELGDRRIRIAQCGPAGENLVRFACILNDLHHANGRTGLGAVMGAKNLRAIAVRGTKHTLEFADREALRAVAAYFKENFRRNPDAFGLHVLGTSQYVRMCQDAGVLPTRNWTQSVFEGAEGISGEHIHRTIFLERRGCYACPLRCKQVVAADGVYTIDPAYGGPEYESLAALGSYCGIGDTVAVCKANELCNKYGLDTISTGGTIAFAMECYERGLISKDTTGGLELRFGNAAAQLELIEQIAFRRGLGDLLAEGSLRAAESIGGEALELAMQVKGQELPAHDPRFKGMMALGYAVSTVGADHQRTEHDDCYALEAPDLMIEQARALGLYEKLPVQSLDPSKVRMFYYFKLYYGLTASLCVCHFTIAPLRVIRISSLPEVVRAATGWESTLWELMKVGERKVNMFKVFNVLHGFSRKDDRLPSRMFQGIASGPKQGWRVEPAELEKAIDLYYEMMNWDAEGIPRRAKLVELELDWLWDKLVKHRG